MILKYKNLKLLLSIVGLLLLFCQCKNNVSLDVSNSDSEISKEEIIKELNFRISNLNIDNADMSQFLEEHDTLEFLFNSLKEYSNIDATIYFPINNFMLKFYLRHIRRGCMGHNVSNPSNEIAQWILETAKSQIINKEQFKEMTYSGFVYYSISEDSLSLDYDISIYKDIELRLDSCELFNSITPTPKWPFFD